MKLWQKLFVAFMAIALLGWLLTHLPQWFWHPLGVCAGTHAQVIGCKGYNLWSGIISDISEISLVGAALTLVAGFYHQHNCHVSGCPWLVFHAHPLHGHPVCKRHWKEEGTEHDLNHPYHGLPNHKVWKTK